jgi:hypothetical protein
VTKGDLRFKRSNMEKRTSEKKPVELTAEQMDLLEFLEPREIPGIYGYLEEVYSTVTHEGPESLEPPLKMGSYYLYVLLRKIGRINPDFNPLEE